MEVFFLMLLISITYLLGLYLSFQKGKKYQFENDKKMLDKLKNNEQLLDVVYNHFNLKNKSIKVEINIDKMIAEQYRNRIFDNTKS
jgi:predicted Holliday junction resolvase-like endonuclease